MKGMSKTKKIVAVTSVIVAILIGTVGIYSLTKEHTPQFSLKDNKTIKLISIHAPLTGCDRKKSKITT